jgi:hypothetical protein
MLLVELSNFVHFPLMGLDILLDDDLVFVDELLFLLLLLFLLGKSFLKGKEFVLGVEAVQIDSTDFVLDVFHIDFKLLLLLPCLQDLFDDLLGQFLFTLES